MGCCLRSPARPGAVQGRAASRHHHTPALRLAAQVAGYDRHGMLHSLSHALWESDTTVFKAHITTSPNGKVAE